MEFPLRAAHLIFIRLPDSSDIYNSPLFTDSDPDSGLGGWGNPAADFEVQDGAFSGFKLSYPYPHTLRRNFTLRPWLDTYDPNFPIDRFKLANQSFTPSAVANLVNGHVGDLEGFQAEIADRQVSPLPFTLFVVESDGEVLRERIGRFTNL